MDAPTIETQRLTLRPFRAADVDAMVREILGNANVTATLPEAPATPEEQRQCAKTDYIDGYSGLWDTHGYGGWAVCSRSGEIAPEGTLIGFCGFSPGHLEGEGAELAYGYGEAYWGKGVGKEAATAALDWLFQQSGQDRANACHYQGNDISKRILEGLGMTFIGDYDVWDSVAAGRGLMATYAVSREDYLARGG